MIKLVLEKGDKSSIGGAMENKYKKILDKLFKLTEKECYSIFLTEEKPDILDDKIGGLPYLPVGEEYPLDKKGNPMPLLLQIDLKNIDLPNWPKSGVLEIFVDSELTWPADYKIKYFKGGQKYQTDLPKVETNRFVVKEGRKIGYKKAINHISRNDNEFIPILCKVINELYDADVHNYAELDDWFGDFPWEDKYFDALEFEPIILGGNPDFVQNDIREEDDKRTECLFKLDANANPQWFSIGDCGIIFVLISPQDIKNQHFENATLDWDCF